MKLFIDNTTLVADVKNIFTSNYPFLKIELYKDGISVNHYALKKEPLSSNLPLQLSVNANSKKIIDINDNITVAALENEFASIGLVAEIFRKSGNVWIETSLTCNWTLQQQNAEGEEISRHFSIKKINSSNHN